MTKDGAPNSNIAHGARIEFHPPLPPFKREILGCMAMGSYIKFVLTYDEAYWLNSGYSGDFVSNGGLQTRAMMEGSQPLTLLMDGTGAIQFCT